MLSFRSLVLSSLIIILFLSNAPIYGQEIQQHRFDEFTSVVSDYTYNELNTPETNSIPQLLDWGIRGFIFHLKLKSDSTGINILTPANKELDFSQVSDVINQYCEKNTSRVISLFFDYDFDSDYLSEYLRNQTCYSKIWQGVPSVEWPTIESLLSKGNQIVCFGFKKNTVETPMIKYLWDYAVEPYYTLDIDPEINGEFRRGELKNELLFLTCSQIPKGAEGLHFPYHNKDVNQNPYFIEHNINLWKNTGKRPTFLVSNKINLRYLNIRNHLRTQLSISGTVSYDRNPLSKVYWEGDKRSVTYGQYCFPATLSEDLVLRPQKPGFRFVPDELRLENITENTIQNFIAVPVDVQQEMVAYFPFINSIQDEGPNKFDVQNSNVKMVFDSQRNEVAEFNGKSFIVLPSANTLGLSNNDFTVSAWVKLEPKNDDRKRDFTILGTEESYYRGGLHLLIRNSKPYFGFYSNDLAGNTELDANRWYHIVWRYTKFNQEQAVFLNGKADGDSPNHPAFVSNGNLYIGKSINQNNHFEGRMDDVVIWNRALGEEEIWNLYQDVFYLNDNRLTNYLLRNKLWLGICFSLVLILLAIYIRKNIATRSKKYKMDFQAVELNDIFPKHNTIKLFGEFQVIDKKGEDISDKFTPRLKQIFILLITTSKENSNGISLEEFVNIIWPNFDRRKAINNRGVSISKLRQVLELMDGVKICNYQERWNISLSDEVYCDYYECLHYLNTDLFSKKEDLNSFLGIINSGVYLQDSIYPWLDDIKGKVTNNVIDILTHLLNEFDLKQNPELVIQIADRILIADDINEEAIKYKIKALLLLNQTNQAKFLYKSFKERYFELNKEQFPLSYEILTH